MVKLKTPLLSFKAQGGLGQVLTFLHRRGQHLVERSPKPPDAKSLAQLSWRHMYQKAVALWHALSALEQAEWESSARMRHMTGFAWFMSQALRPNPGLYLPLQGGTMQGDIDMDGYKIEDLPAPAAADDAATKAYVDLRALSPGEGHITILPQSYKSIIQGVWVWQAQAGQWAGFEWRNTSTNNGDEINYSVYLAAGTYSFGLLTRIGANDGIVDIYIDAVEVASFDLYSAAVNRNRWRTQAGIVVAAEGLKTLRLKLDGKNPASGDYNISFSYIVLWRTA